MIIPDFISIVQVLYMFQACMHISPPFYEMFLHWVQLIWEERLFSSSPHLLNE